MRYWSENRRKQTAEAFLAGVHAVQKAVEPVQKTGDLPNASLTLLVKAALEPGTFLLDMYRMLGLHPAEGKAAQEDLVARGFVRLHRLVRKGRGGQPQVLEVTRAGADVVVSRGMTLAPRLLKGGFKHDCYARLIGRWAGKQSMRCTYERTLGAKTFDLVLEDGKGQLTGVEICLSGASGMTAQQLMKASAVAGVNEVLALFETQAMQRSVAQAFAGVDQLGLYKGKVRLALLAEFME